MKKVKTVTEREKEEEQQERKVKVEELEEAVTSNEQQKTSHRELGKRREEKNLVEERATVALGGKIGEKIYNNITISSRRKVSYRVERINITSQSVTGTNTQKEAEQLKIKEIKK